MMFPFGITVTVQRQAEDKFGNFTTISTHQIPGCAVDYTGSGRAGAATSIEQTHGAETVERRATLFTPPNADIVSTDFVLLTDGTRWSVVGAVAEAMNPFTGWHPGGAIILQRVTG